MASVYGTAVSSDAIQPDSDLNLSTVSADSIQESTPLLPSNRGKEKYSVFSLGQKKFIIFTAALASTFSPFSSNIYYPAINSIAKDLHVGPAMINWTITAYMIFQGLAPTFMGNLSDTAGRRPVYMLCFAIYIFANIGLALQRNFWALLAFRALQSTGISATVALSNAVAADTVTSAERGMYMGIASLGGVLGPALGPTLGGTLSQYLGWRAIFWFLAILATIFFIALMLFYPETCRNIVGNGSIPPPSWNRSFLNYLDERRKDQGGLYSKQDYHRRDARASKRQISFPNPLSTLRLLFELPTSIVLISNGIGFAAYYTVTSSIPSQWALIYRLNDFQLGLIYIPIGLGTIISSFTSGWLIDQNFRRIALRDGIPGLKDGKQDLSEFPIEKARLQIAIPMAILAATSIAIYGWVTDELPIAVPLVLLFLIGYFVTASYNVMNVLIVDLNYDTPATATAANNLVRCFLGAAATAGIMPLLEAYGRRLSFGIVAGVWIACIPLSTFVYWRGAKWRKRRDMGKSENCDV